MVPVDGERELAQGLAEVARELVAADDIQDTLHRIVTLAVKTITNCDHAGLSLVVKGGRIETPRPDRSAGPAADRQDPERHG
jgi:hypothetical protein